MKIFILFSLISFSCAQQLISLSTFEGNNVKNPLKSDGPFGIYVSAHSDSPNILSNIFIVREDGRNASLNLLRVLKKETDSGELEAFPISTSAYLTTSVSTETLRTLGGVIYLSSSKQFENAFFHVIDISVPQTVNFHKFGAIDYSITLFLNTQRDAFPYYSSIISQWEQDNSSSAFIYAGIPGDGNIPPNSQMFSNPVYLGSPSYYFDGFFPTVETFSLVMTAFHVRTYKGGPSFKIEPGAYSVNETTTSAYTTTGFYMKQLGKVDGRVTVHTKRDTKYTGFTGANIVGFFPTHGNVTVGAYDGASKYEFAVPPGSFVTPWTVPVIGENIQISSTDGMNGIYYVQYYVYQSNNTGTTPLPGIQTTSMHVQTTTQSSGSIPFITSLLISMGFLGFM